MTVLNAVHAGEAVFISQDTFYKDDDGTIRSACKLIQIPGSPIIMGATGSVRAYHHLANVISTLHANGEPIAAMVKALPNAWKIVNGILPEEDRREGLYLVIAAHDPDSGTLRAWGALSAEGMIPTEIEPNRFALAPSELDTTADDFPALHALSQQAMNGDDVDAFMIALARHQGQLQDMGKLKIKSGIGGRLIVVELSKAGLVFREHDAFDGCELAGEEVGRLFEVKQRKRTVVGDNGRETDTSASLNRSHARSIATLRQPLDPSRIQHGTGC